MCCPARGSPLFPYTTLFRSHGSRAFLTSCARFGFSEVASYWQFHERSLADWSKKFKPNHYLHLVKFELLRSEGHTSELQSLTNLVCRLLLEKKNRKLKPLLI